MKKSLLVIGHGSRSPEATEIFSRIVSLVREKGGYDFVEGAHMSLTRPNIDEAVDILARKNVKEIVVMPYFLYNGVHIKHDIPEIIGEIASRYPDIEIRLAEPIGFDPVMADLIIQRAGVASSLNA